MTRLLVEVDDFVDASKWVYEQTADPTRVAFGRLTEALTGSSNMAGDDPGGQSWARVYDAAAQSACEAAGMIVNAAYRTSTLFGQSASNYADAEAASTAAEQARASSLVAGLPPETSVGPASRLPSAAGGSGGAPTGWGLVKHLVGYLWPDGHQDRLHHAATAWQTAADHFEDASWHVRIAPVPFARDGLPESADMVTVCTGLGQHYLDLASAFRSLGQACTDLATHIDACHRAVEDQLDDLVEWTLGIQVGGGLLSIVTVGLAEAPTQAAQVAKIAAVANKVRELIEAFIAAAKLVGEALPTITLTAERIKFAMEGLAGARLAVAGMESVSLTKTGVTVGRGVKLTKELQAEVAATTRLVEEATNVVETTAGRFNLDRVPPTVRDLVSSTIDRAKSGIKSFTGHDGKDYDNWKNQLPEGGTYTEWTVARADQKRGVNRLIIDGPPSDPTAIYYWDHVNPPIWIGPVA